MQMTYTLPVEDPGIQQDRRFESEGANKRLLKRAYFSSHITLPPLSSLTAMATIPSAPSRCSHESAVAETSSDASFPAPSVRNDRLCGNSDVPYLAALHKSKRSLLSHSSPALLSPHTMGQSAGQTLGQSRRMSEPGSRERNFMLNGGFAHDRHHARLPQHRVPGRHGNFLDFQSLDFAHYVDNCAPNHVHRMSEKSNLYASRSFDGSYLRQVPSKLEPLPPPPNAFQQLDTSTKLPDAQHAFGIHDDTPRAMRVFPNPALTTMATSVPHAYARVPVHDAAYMIHPEYACSAAYSPAVVPKKGLLPTPVPSSAVPLNVRNPKRSARPSDPSAIDLPPAKAQKGTRSHARSKNTGNHVCLGCQATSTPEWRKGPTGPRTLCNACGLLYAKMYRKREQDAVAAAIACNRDPTQAKKEIADALLQPDCREEQLESIRAGVRVVASMKQHRMGVNLIKTDVRAMPPMIKPTN